MDPKASSKETITFNELSYMTNQWISDLQYSQCVFDNQNAELSALLNKMLGNRINLESIHSKLNYIKCSQEDVEQDISRISQYESYMEMLVSCIENKTAMFDGKTVTDVFRQQIFKTAEQIFVTLKNMEESCEDTLVKMKDKFKCSLDEPFEAMAQILMTQLDILEQIEMKISQLKSKAQVYDCKMKLALQKFKLKENKMF